MECPVCQKMQNKAQWQPAQWKARAACLPDGRNCCKQCDQDGACITRQMQQQVRALLQSVCELRIRMDDLVADLSEILIRLHGQGTAVLDQQHDKFHKKRARQNIRAVGNDVLKYGMMLLAPRAVEETGVTQKLSAGRLMEAALYQFLIVKNSRPEFQLMRLVQYFLEDLHDLCALAKIVTFLSWEDLSESLQAILTAEPRDPGPGSALCDAAASDSDD
ncbi:unnamed protein product [Symbiodinium sp. CCMP2592]|nr:unnamed protein product [Symbiodinium sp. CCMP2592]